MKNSWLIHSKLELDDYQIIFNNGRKLIDFKTLSFFEFYLFLVNNQSNLDNNDLLDKLVKLFNYTANYDPNNSHLLAYSNYLDEITEKSCLYNLKNKLIYLHKSYSVLVEDPVTNICNAITISNASNVLELYLENKYIIEYYIEEINNSLKNIHTFSINFPHQLAKELTILRTHVVLNNMLAEDYAGEIASIYVKVNNASDAIAFFSDHKMQVDCYNYISKNHIFIYKSINNGLLEYKVFPVDTSNRLFDCIYYDYKNYLVNNERSLFFIEKESYLRSFDKTFNLINNQSNNQNIVINNFANISHIYNHNIFNIDNTINIFNVNINVILNRNSSIFESINLSSNNSVTDNVNHPVDSLNDNSNSNIFISNSPIGILSNPIRNHSNNQSAINVIRNNYSNNNIWTADEPNIKTVNISSKWSPDSSVMNKPTVIKKTFSMLKSLFKKN